MGEAVAGELGLEPRMTVPKTGVLPLHHSPAGPASAALSCGGGGQIGQTVFGCNTPIQDNFRRLRRRSKWTLAASETHGYKPRPHFGATPCGPAPTVGVWLSLVEHCVRDAGVGGSNPLTPTSRKPTKTVAFIIPKFPEIAVSQQNRAVRNPRVGSRPSAEIRYCVRRRMVRYPCGCGFGA